MSRSLADVQERQKVTLMHLAGAGRVVAIGNGTTTTLKEGDAVGIKWLADSCLNCENCREGQEATCPLAETSGYSKDGSFQQ